MPKVKIAASCNWSGRRYEAGDVIEVADRTLELNPGLMTATDAAVTSAESRPTVDEYAAAATKKAATKKADKGE